MKQEKVKIDVIGTVKDTAGAACEFTFFAAILSVIVGCLFAPCFTVLFERSLRQKYDVTHNNENITYVHRDLAIINVIMWVIAILAWSAVIYTNLEYGKIPTNIFN